MEPTSTTYFTKYMGDFPTVPFTARTQRAWLIDIGDPARWSTTAVIGNCAQYNSNVVGPDYTNYTGVMFPGPYGTFSNGLWTGAKNTDWFDCRNWDDAEVPTAASNVVINQTRLLDCVVDNSVHNPLSAPAVCNKLKIESNSATVPQLSINSNKQLIVSDSTTIKRTAAGLIMGLTVNSGTFTTATLTLTGSAAGAANARFRNLSAANSVQVYGNLTIADGGRLDLTNGGISLSGHFRSLDATSGANAFLETNSLVLFTGASAQSIQTNGFQEVFSTLRVSKSGSDLSLNAPVLINTNLDLLNRRVFSTATNLMSLAAAATATNATNASFVSGPVQKFGTADFTFPVGKSTYYRPASLTTITGLATDAYTAEYFLTPAPATAWVLGLFPGTLDATLDHISDCEYWQIDRSNGTPNAFVTLSWDAATSCGVTLMADLRVARYDGAVWRDRGNGGTTGTLLAGTVISSASQTAFSPWTLASVSAQNPLPIELMYFTAVPHGDVVNLEWATATELNNDRFIVERSVDGFNFQPVVSRSGAGNSASMIEYQDLDRSPLPGLSYYRLGQIDLDGTTTWSDLVPVEFNASGTRPLTVLYGTEELIAVHGFASGASFEVIDPLGRVVFSGTSGQAGRTPLQLSNLAHGTYVLRISSGSRSESTQFVR
ncbi:MAG: T9SS type A sorting domain-containing protein [Flavobacteriales bacterium]|nr:T9SS type A sorting domain-containing protein [Flavobacteriales bacterium]